MMAKRRQSSCVVFFYVNPLQPNIRAYILHTALCTFPRVLTRRICLTIKSLFSWWSFPFSRDLNVIFMVVLFSPCFCFLWVHLFVFILFCFLFFELTELLCTWGSMGQAEQNSEIVMLSFFFSQNIGSVSTCSKVLRPSLPPFFIA